MRLVLIKGPIGVVVLVVPHDEGDCWNLELGAVLCLGICGDGVAVWLVKAVFPITSWRLELYNVTSLLHVFTSPLRWLLCSQ
jgi:hypothetical protein